MFDHTHYVPVLKGKEDGYRSLFEIDAKVRSHLTPLIEVPPIPWDFVSDEQAKPTDVYLTKITENLEICWGADSPIFVDLQPLSGVRPLDDGRHPLRFVFDEARARSKQLPLVPVTGLTRNASYQAAVRDAAGADRRGVCLRITSEDFEEADNLEGELNELLTSLELTPEDVDLILDLGEIPATRTGFVLLAAKSIVRGLPFVSDWRTLTLVASAFPHSLSRLVPAEVSTAQRAEWIVWESLARCRATIPRLPTFGDYAVSHAEFIEHDSNIEGSHMDLRYTTDRNWLILKGHDSKRHGNHGFNGLCRLLMERPEYKGPAFSWGDAYAHACATNSASAIDAATWRMVGTTHHLVFVTTQIAGINGL